METFAGGASVACRIASFHHIEKWCQQRQVRLWRLELAAIERYMWTPRRKGRISAAIARKRFHDLAWLKKYRGFPVGLAGRVPLAKAPAGSIFEERQAVPADPAWMLTVAAAWARAKPGSAQATSLSMSWMIWKSAGRL